MVFCGFRKYKDTNRRNTILARTRLSDTAMRWSRTRAKEAHTARTYLSFCSMKQLRVFLLPPGRDASASEGYPQQYVAGTHFIHLGGERQCGLSFLSKETTRWQGLGLEPKRRKKRAHKVSTHGVDVHFEQL